MVKLNLLIIIFLESSKIIRLKKILRPRNITNRII